MIDARFMGDTFWSKVDKTDGCWMWLGGIDGQGYGRHYIGIIDGKKVRRGAHRLAYEDLVGPIPPGLQLDHLCRVRLCVRPDHLEPVTRKENILRGEGPSAQHARKTHCPRGHEYDGRLSCGKRYCKKCARDKTARRKAASR